MHRSGQEKESRQMEVAQRVKLGLFRKQFEFMQSRDPELLFSGAVGAGKSYALACKVLAKAQIPGNKVGLCRKTFESLEKSTLDTLLTILEQATAPGMIRGFTRNKNEKTIHIIGGGRIDYFGLDDIRKIGSYQFGSIGVDEAIELAEDDWKWLLSRIRHPADPYRQLFGATNPGSRTHFLYQRFFCNAPPVQGSSRRVITSTTYDNVTLPRGYIEAMGYTGAWERRFIQGEWCNLQGGIYDTFSRTTHVKDRPFTDFVSWVAGVDDGWTHPRACLIAGVDVLGRIHVAEEYYRSGETYPQFLAWLTDMAQVYPLDVVVCDPSASQLIAVIEEAGLPVDGADNAVLPGIQRVQSAIAVRAFGAPEFPASPWLTIAPRCESTLTEMDAYAWAINRLTGKAEDRPVKLNDDAMDALRYLVMAVHGGAPLTIDAVGAENGGRAKVEDADGWGLGDNQGGHKDDQNGRNTSGSAVAIDAHRHGEGD